MGGAESKITFRQGLNELIESKNLTEKDESFWENFWILLNSVEEVFSLVSPTDIRKILEEVPNNMHLLLEKAVGKLFNIFDNRSNLINKQDQKKVLNIFRILTRIIPFLFEDKSRDWQKDFFQKQSKLKSDQTNGEIIINSVIDSLFLPGLTLPEDVQKKKDGSYTIIWETGVGASTAPTSTVELDANRTEVLKFLLVLTSQLLYSSSKKFRAQGVPLTNLFLRKIPKPTVMALLASLINVVVHYDPIGIGLPYNYVLFSDSREALTTISLQVLLVLLDYQFPRELVEKGTSSPDPEDAPKNMNLFQEYLSKIHRAEDFNVIVVGLSRLLNNPIETTNTYLPGSAKSISIYQELVIFTWKFLELNKRFLQYLLQDPLLFDIIIPLLVFAIQARKDEGKIGLINLVCFLLLSLSGERNFGVRLNSPYEKKVDALLLPAFEGNYADVLILSIYKLLTDGDRSKLFSLYDCMLTIIANISPYIKSISSVTCYKLLNLFRFFSSPRFVFANATNYNLCVILLDVFNNMIQYQFDGNIRLIYAIVRQKELFEQLHDLEFSDKSKSKSEDQSQLNKEEGSTKETSPTSPKSETPNSPNSPNLPNLPSTSNTPNTPNSPKELVSLQERDANPKGTQSFVATQEWFWSWKKTLPLTTIQRLTQVLVPQIEKVCVERGYISEEEVLKYLSNGTLVGLLPVPHPIMVRKYKTNIGTQTWGTVFLWGTIYLQNSNPPIWFGTKIELFLIKQI